MSAGGFELTSRAKRILYAVITEFIATGEPVGSRTLSRKYQLELSAASIRNVLADLEEAGFLLQPHASAGRVPSDRAFRVFIDALMQTRDITSIERNVIESRFDQLGPGSDVLRETARLLSGLTGAAALVVAPKLEGQPLKQLRFIPTRPGELLAVVVTASGDVENRFIQVDKHPTNDELTRVHNLLDDVLEGRSLREVRELFARRLQDVQNELGALRRQAFELGQAALQPVSTQVEVVIEGQANLFDKPEFADIDRIKQLIRVLEERERLVGILDRTLETRGVRILLPGDDEPGLDQLSLVAMRYESTNQGISAAGTVGVLGPTRMDYPAIIPLVHETARELGAFLGRRSARGHALHQDDRD